MIFCLVVEYALSSSMARLPAFDFWTTSCWSITATLKVSADNPGDTIASHNATAPIKPVTLVRSIESSSALYEYHTPGSPPNKIRQKPAASRGRDACTIPAGSEIRCSTFEIPDTSSLPCLPHLARLARLLLHHPNIP